MPIIDKVGRKAKSVKILIIIMYTILIIGGITMVYPFILMLSSSITTVVDYNEFSIIPRYLFDDEWLYRKYLCDKYNGAIVTSLVSPSLNTLCQTDYIKFETIPSPKLDFSSKENKNKFEDFEQFKAKFGQEYKQAGFLANKGDIGKVLFLYRKMLSKKFKGDITALNKYYNDENESFKTINPPYGRYLTHIWKPDNSIKWKEWLEFEKVLPSCYLYTISCDGLFQTWLSIKYQNNINLLNKEYQTQYNSFSSIVLSAKLPENVKERRDWLEYVRTKLPLKYLKITGNENLYRDFLRSRHKDITRLNKRYGTAYKSFSELKLIDDTWLVSDAGLVDWNEFIGNILPPEYLYVKSADNLYREFLFNKYKNIETLNSKYKTKYNDFIKINAPYIEGEYFELIKNKNSLRKYFLFKNYINVIDYILLHGRAVLNTVMFCLLIIATVLIVNPLCAYALSRFNLKYTQKILLFLLATMAFPAEVSLIPNFLLLKKLGMLNTYWALFLPGMASGFSIFLLKGFFDSLPQELYESASIDGASEMMMFFRITLPLAKPVIAFLALGAFTSAYGAFMYALIVCQNPDMWTIMVWLYDMQNWAPSSMQMAGYVIATIPTLLVFIFAQNIIMRGIILPVEH